MDTRNLYIRILAGFLCLFGFMICCTSALPQAGLSSSAQIQISHSKPAISQRIIDFEKKFGIRIYVDSFLIDTSRAEIVRPMFPVKQNSTAKKDSLPDLIQRGVSKYSFSYLQQDDESSRDSLLNIFFEEWEKYPVSFVGAAALKAVAFVKNLKVQGQARYAMPEALSNTLYYDVGYVKNRADLYLRHSIHHEFYHLIEKNLFGNFYYSDKTWLSFNPLDFTYGNGGAAAYGNPDFAKRQYPYKGFVTGYATSGIEEDKAEVFAYLMTTADFLKLRKWTEDDQLLASKVAYFMGFLRGICREMDYDYFLRIHQVKMKTISVPVFRNDIY